MTSPSAPRMGVSLFTVTTFDQSRRKGYLDSKFSDVSMQDRITQGHIGRSHTSYVVSKLAGRPTTETDTTPEGFPFFTPFFPSGIIHLRSTPRLRSHPPAMVCEPHLAGHLMGKRALPRSRASSGAQPGCINSDCPSDSVHPHLIGMRLQPYLVLLPRNHFLRRRVCVSVCAEHSPPSFRPRPFCRGRPRHFEAGFLASVDAIPRVEPNADSGRGAHAIVKSGKSPPRWLCRRSPS